MTPTQALVLDVLTKAIQPMSAYDVLAKLRMAQPKAGPPTAYRALEKLISIGKAHRIESINAYVACCGDHAGGQPAFAICDDCGTVREHSSAAIAASLTEAARHGGFEPRRTVIELHGTCRDCRDNST